MKVEAASPSQTKSPGKAKKRKGEMINDLLAMSMAHIKVKKEPISDGEEETSRKSLTTSKKGLDTSRVDKQASETLKKKRSKPHNDNQAISRDEPAVKKIKTEKASEDERNDSSAEKVKVKQNREFHYSKIKKEKGISSNSFMEERDALEKLFSEPALSFKELNSSKDSHKYPREELKLQESNSLKSKGEVPKLKLSFPKTSVVKGTKFPQPVHIKAEKTHPESSLSKSRPTSDQVSLGKLNNINSENSLHLQSNSMDTSESSDSEKATNNRRKRLKSEKSPRSLNKLISGPISNSFENNLSDSDSDEYMGNQRATASFKTQSPSVKRHARILEKSQGKSDLDNKSSENSSESSDDENDPRKRITGVNNNSDKSSSSRKAPSAGTGKVKVPKTRISNLKQAKMPVPMLASVKSEKYSSEDSDKYSVHEVSDRVLPAVHIDTESSKSSNEDLHSPNAKQIKSDLKNKQHKNSEQSLKSKVAKMLFGKSAEKSSESERISDKHIAQPKSIRTEINDHSTAERRKRLSVSLLKKTNRTMPEPDNSSSSEDDSSRTAHQLKQKNNERVLPVGGRDAECCSSSDEQVAVSKEKQIKAKSSGLQNKQNRRTSASSRSSEDRLLKTANTLHNSSGTESSSDEDVPLPKPIKSERMKRPEASEKKKRLSVPLPINTDRKISDSDDSSSSTDHSSIRAAQLRRKVDKKVLSAVDRGSGSSSSSDEEISVPEPKQMKLKTSKLQDKEKRRVSGPTRGSQDKSLKSKITCTRHNNSAVRNSEMESSSDEDVPLPKPIKNEHSKAPGKRLSVPLPMKTDRKTSDSDHSSSSEDDSSSRVPQLTRKVTEKAVDRGSESSSSSEEESSVPEPKQMKLKSFKLQDKEKRLSTGPSRSSEGKSPKSTITHTQHKNSGVKNSEMESSSNEEVQLPKPIKNEGHKHSKLSGKRLSVPLPMKADRKTSESDDSSSSEEDNSSRVTQLTQKVNEKALPTVNRDSESRSSSEEETSVPEPKHMESSKFQNKVNSRISSATRRSADKSPKSKIKQTHSNPAVRSSEMESSSDEDVPLPKPIKHEKNEHSKAADKKKRLSVPLPIKADRKMSDSDDSGDDSSSRAPQITRKINEKDQAVRRESRSSSSSEADVPPPKKIKLENNRIPSLGRNVQIPPSMSWIEKIEHRFPGIEKQTIKLHLPEDQSTKYSLLLVPKHIDPRNLVNLKCNLNKNTVVNLNKKEYIFELLPKKPDPVVVNLDRPRLVKLHSVISLQRFVPELKLKELVAPKRENVSLPSEIKVRHPLFGASYKEKISLNKNVKRKLQEAIEHKRKLEEKEKHRRKSKKKSQVQSVEETIMDIFNSSAPTRNISDIDLIPVKKEDSATELNSSKSKHKSKHNRENMSTADAIVENQFLDTTKRKHKSKKKDKEIVSNTMETSGNSFSEDSHKKKKRKSRDSLESSLENESRKKKHK